MLLRNIKAALLALVPLAALCGCTPVHLTRNEMAYQSTRAPKAELARKTVITVMPFIQNTQLTLDARMTDDYLVMERYLEPGLASSGNTLEIYPRRLAGWLADELRDSSYFKDVTTAEWSDWRSLSPKPDFIIYGEINYISAIQHKYILPWLPPQIIVTLMGLLPTTRYEHDFDITLHVADGARPDRVLFSKNYRVTDPDNGTHSMYTGKPRCPRAAAYLNECYASHEAKTMFPPVYAQFRDELAKALAPDGPLAAALKTGGN